MNLETPTEGEDATKALFPLSGQDKTVTLCLEYDTKERAERAAHQIELGLRGGGKILDFGDVECEKENSLKDRRRVFQVVSSNDPSIAVGYAIYVQGQFS